MTKPSTRLLAWYDQHGRKLPWRCTIGEKPLPYHVWISEIMLQQTTTVTVAPYYRDFLNRWPRIEDLAAAPLDAVLHAWQGLGYYARARNLHRCAKAVCSDHGGQFPDTEEALRGLPGIGVYTAAAIVAIAFDKPATVVDGNVERVMARLFAVEQTLPSAKKNLSRLAHSLTPKVRPGDYAQAVMDLGATICTPRSPSCGRCPWAGKCQALAKGLTGELPRREVKPDRPTRYGITFWMIRADGAVLLRRRPEKGLLGGMIELPSTPWRPRRWSHAAALTHAPVSLDWRRIPGDVHHVFTHFSLDLVIYTGAVGETPIGDIDGFWRHPDQVADLALPTLTKKLIRHALSKTSHSFLTQIKESL